MIRFGAPKQTFQFHNSSIRGRNSIDTHSCGCVYHSNSTSLVSCLSENVKIHMDGWWVNQGLFLKLAIFARLASAHTPFGCRLVAEFGVNTQVRCGGRNQDEISPVGRYGMGLRSCKYLNSIWADTRKGGRHPSGC